MLLPAISVALLMAHYLARTVFSVPLARSSSRADPLAWLV